MSEWLRTRLVGKAPYQPLYAFHFGLASTERCFSRVGGAPILKSHFEVAVHVGGDVLEDRLDG